jgi:hypothetical protein
MIPGRGGLFCMGVGMGAEECFELWNSGWNPDYPYTRLNDQMNALSVSCSPFRNPGARIEEQLRNS